MIYELTLKGTQFIAAREALVKVPYRDGWQDKAKTIPRWSKGYGGPAGENDPPLTDEEGFDLLKLKVKEYAGYVNNQLKGALVTQFMFDALVSLEYQSGPNEKETLFTAIQKGDMIWARDEILTIKQKISAGHARRRRQEADLFLRGNYGDLSTILVWETADTSPALMKRAPMPQL